MRYLALGIFLTGCAHNISQNDRFGFLEGPPRAKCSPETPIAQVGRPWLWTCLVEGDLKPYAQVPVVIKTTQYKAEEFPTASVQGLGLHRVYTSKAIFPMSYYLILRSKQPVEPGEFGTEVIDPNDPRGPVPSIEGLEESFNGDFWLKIEWFEVRAFDGENVTLGKRLTEGTVRGRLNCMTCAI